MVVVSQQKFKTNVMIPLKSKYQNKIKFVNALIIICTFSESRYNQIILTM